MTKSKQPDDQKVEPQLEQGRPVSGAFSHLMPTDRAVWGEARRLVGNKNIRVEDLAICAAQDPIIVLELLRISNAMFFSGGRSPITAAKTAIIRLGSDVVLETLDKIGERPDLDDAKVAKVFEENRGRSKRISIVASIIAEALARNLTDDAQTAALFVNIGELLAIMHLGPTYLKLAENTSRATVNYRLAQDHKFDCERMGVTYLRRNGIPEAILFALDREAASRVPERAILRPICQAATEMCEAFDLKRWEKIAPGKQLPPKSSIRMLQIADPQYLRVYERASEYLFSAKVLDDMRRESQGAASHTTHPATVSSEALSADIGAIMELNQALPQTATPSAESSSPEAPSAALPSVEKTPLETLAEQSARQGMSKAIKTVRESAENVDQFKLVDAKKQRKTLARRKEQAPIAPPVINTKNGATLVTSITENFEKATRSEELLAQLLESLVDKGPFEKSALIVVSKDRRHAVVVAARGPNIGNGQKLSLDDPLSPLAQCFSKVQSFGNRESPVSPFGSRAFALSPIDADHETPVALYADCGNLSALSFEARRVFRAVVDVLNKRLPSIPGGIPVEITV